MPDDDYVDYKFTDQDGQEIWVYLVSNGDMIMRWPDGYRVHFNQEQTREFMDALGECVRDGIPLTINIQQWMH